MSDSNEASGSPELSQKVPNVELVDPAQAQRLIDQLRDSGRWSVTGVSDNVTRNVFMAAGRKFINGELQRTLTITMVEQPDARPAR